MCGSVYTTYVYTIVLHTGSQYRYQVWYQVRGLVQGLWLGTQDISLSHQHYYWYLLPIPSVYHYVLHIHCIHHQYTYETPIPLVPPQWVLGRLGVRLGVQCTTQGVLLGVCGGPVRGLGGLRTPVRWSVASQLASGWGHHPTNCPHSGASPPLHLHKGGCVVPYIPLHPQVYTRYTIGLGYMQGLVLPLLSPLTGGVSVVVSLYLY